MLLDGIDRLELNPLELFLWSALPPAGWRLPSYRGAQLTVVRIEREPGRAAVRRRAGGKRALATAAAVHARCLDADRLLARGELQPALDAYSLAPDGAGNGEPSCRRLYERRLAVLASMPARFDEAVALGAKLSPTMRCT